MYSAGLFTSCVQAVVKHGKNCAQTIGFLHSPVVQSTKLWVSAPFCTQLFQCFSDQVSTAKNGFNNLLKNSFPRHPQALVLLTTN